MRTVADSASAVPAAEMREGIDLLRRGRFMDSHEAFERGWRASSGPEREVWQALAQLAAAFVHVERARPRPAACLLGRARRHLERVPERCCGVDIQALRREVGRWHERLLAATAGELLRSSWRPVVRTASAPSDSDPRP